MITPAYNYLLVKKVERDTGVVVDEDIEDTHQKFEVVAVPEFQGFYVGGLEHRVETEYKVGDVIWVQKHADADNPKELEQQGLALILIERVMALEVK